MKCPICDCVLVMDGELESYGCLNNACLASNFHGRDISFWEVLKRQIKAAATPRWRPFDLDEMRKSLPVIVADRRCEVSPCLITDEESIVFLSKFGDTEKRIVWMPAPKVEVK